MSRGAGRRALAVAVTLVVVAAVGVAFLVLGTPGDERLRRLDEARIVDLMALRGAAAEHFAREGRLPESLDQLARRSPRAVRTTEPGRGRLYGYEALDDSSFRLCATFDFATPNEPTRPGLATWAHRAGRQCFRFRIGQNEAAGPGGDLLPVLEEAAPASP